MNEEDKIRVLKQIQEIREINIDNDRLILYVINLLKEMKIEPTFDKTVVAAFKLFPSRFSLVGFEEYPDGKRVHDCLFHCTYKTKGWLIGNAQSGYKISNKGKYYLEEFKKIMNKEIELPKKYSEKVKRKEKTAIDLLKKSKAFNKYTNEKRNKINKEDIRDALRIFKYADSRNVEKNLNRYILYAKILEDKIAIEFLNFMNKNKGELI